MQTRKTMKVDAAYLRGYAEPKSFNGDKMTMDVVFSTGMKGLRSSLFSEYFEELSLNPGSVRLDRLNNGAPVLANHNSDSLDSVMGVVENARIENGKGVATIRFSKSELFSDLISRIKEGIISKLSVGYQVYKYEKVKQVASDPNKDDEDETPLYRAVDWEPFEISFVTVPFDHNAQVRSHERATECEFLDTVGEKEMKTRTQDAVESVVDAVTPETVETVENAPAAKEPTSEEVRTHERSRILAIRSACQTAKLEEKFEKELIDGNVSIEDASKRILAEWTKRGSNMQLDNKVDSVEITRDPQDVMSRGIANALLNRANPVKNKLSEEGRTYRGLTLMEMASEMADSRGLSLKNVDRSTKAKRFLHPDFWQRSAGYHGTDDFPTLLADTARKTLQQAYNEEGRSFLPFVRFVSNPDFKTITRLQLGEAPSMEEIPEHAEIRYGTISDKGESYAVKTYGKAFAMTRQLMINDDLNAFARLPQLFGAAAARLESDLVYAIFTGNPLMADGNALFSSAHQNLGTTGVINQTSLSEMRKLGRLQTGVGGLAKLNVILKYLIVPASLETAAMVALSPVIPNAVTGVNVFSGAYQIIAEPRLDVADVNDWFAAASPSQVDTIEVAYLDGDSGVRLDEEVDFDTEGMKMAARHDVGVKAIDWRGLYMNEGA